MNKHKKTIIIIAIVILVAVLAYRWHKKKSVVAPAKSTPVAPGASTNTSATPTSGTAPAASPTSFDGMYGGSESFTPTEGIYGSYNGHGKPHKVMVGKEGKHARRDANASMIKKQAENFTGYGM